jgi:hypothetical protein
VEVLENHHEWLLRGDDLEHASYCPGSIGCSRLTDTEYLGDPIADGWPVGLAGQTFAECRRHRLGVSSGSAGGLRQQLDEWRERDADAIRGGLTHEDPCSLAGRVGELGREARLTDARRGQHGDEYACAGIDHVIERLFQHPKWAVAPYHRSIDPRRHLA